MFLFSFLSRIVPGNVLRRQNIKRTSMHCTLHTLFLVFRKEERERRRGKRLRMIAQARENAMIERNGRMEVAAEAGAE